jgi:hypothetical protein
MCARQLRSSLCDLGWRVLPRRLFFEYLERGLFVVGDETVLAIQAREWHHCASVFESCAL